MNESMLNPSVDPISHLLILAKSVHKKLDSAGIEIKKRNPIASLQIELGGEIERMSMFENLGSAGNRSEEQKRSAMDKYNKFMEEKSKDNLLIFCDGSVSEKEIGGCGIVVVSHVEEEVITANKCLGKFTNNVKAEVEAIVLALINAAEFFTNKAIEQSKKNCIILSDCSSALDVITYHRDLDTWGEHLKRIFLLIKQLKEINVTVKMAWIPGHCNLEFNEIADQEAKKGTRGEMDMFRGNLTISPVELYGKINKDILARWENCWKRTPSGHFTREILPSVGKQVLLPRLRTVAMSKIRGLLNNAAVAEKLFRFGFVESPNCRCGGGRETVEHVFLSCRINQPSREKLVEENGKIWWETRRSGNLNICLKLLLAPNHHELLNPKEAGEVEELVSNFIMEAKIFI